MVERLGDELGRGRIAKTDNKERRRGAERFARFKDPRPHYGVKSIPNDSDKRSPWYKARFVYDLSKLIRARLKELIQSLSYPEHPPPSELLPERDLPYDEWKVLTGGQLRVELQDGRKACLFLGPLDAEERYRGAKVFEIVGNVLS
jgi:hypothetical protein